jgi:hypothetical protein
MSIPEHPNMTALRAEVKRLRNELTEHKCTHIYGPWRPSGHMEPTMFRRCWKCGHAQRHAKIKRRRVR